MSRIRVRMEQRANREQRLKLEQKTDGGRGRRIPNNQRPKHPRHAPGRTTQARHLGKAVIPVITLPDWLND